MPPKEKPHGLTVKKGENFSEWFTQVCSEQGAHLADLRYDVQGFIVHMPWAYRILTRIYEYLEAEVEADGHEPFLFPTVIPKENLTKEAEHAGFVPDVFWVDKAGDKPLEKVVALRPTGESALYPMYSLWIRSHKDLPFKRYQTRITVFRNEKTTRPFLRGREFMFFESHDVFKTHADALAQISRDLAMCERVIRGRLKLPFLYFRRPQFDKFKGAKDTYCPDTVLPDGRRIQLASTHDLGQNFSKAYNVMFTDEAGARQHAWQTCFGPGVWRIMAALGAIHGDDQGLVLPFDVAPVQAVIIPITFQNKPKETSKILATCRKAAALLAKAGIRAKVDGTDASPGYKFNEWELRGAPLRVEVGPRDVAKKQAVIKRRTGEKRAVKMARLAGAAKKEAQLLDQDIGARAKAYFKSNTKDARAFDEATRILGAFRGFVRVPWCSVEMDGKACADELKAQTQGGDVCGTLHPKEDAVPRGSACIVCKKPARHMVYIAKSI